MVLRVKKERLALRVLLGLRAKKVKRAKRVILVRCLCLM